MALIKACCNVVYKRGFINDKNVKIYENVSQNHFKIGYSNYNLINNHNKQKKMKESKP